jgi:hypothetical protein
MELLVASHLKRGIDLKRLVLVPPVIASRPLERLGGLFGSRSFACASDVQRSSQGLSDVAHLQDEPAFYGDGYRG